MPKIQPSAQLYTVRDLTKKDFAEAVRDVARIGYVGVELAGFGNLASVEEVRAAIGIAGLRVIGAHIPIERLETDLTTVLDEQAHLRNRNVICPWLPEARRSDRAAWEQVARSLNSIGLACRERGFTLAYHHHSFEFERFGNRVAMDILRAETDPAVVKFELDVYWLQHAGIGPVAYMQGLGDRVLSLHLKDMAPGADRAFAPVGAGILDFRAIGDAATSMGIQNFIVEQDDTYGVPPLDALRTSFENLKRLDLI